MASPTEAPAVVLDEANQNPAKISERLEGVEKELVRLKWQLRGRNTADGEVQELLKIVGVMKKINQNLVEGSGETERGESSRGRGQRESGFYNVGGSQSLFGVGGIGGPTSINSSNSPITFHTSKSDQTGKK